MWTSLYVEIILLIIGFGLIGYAWIVYRTPNVFPAATNDEFLTVKYPNDSSLVQASNGVEYTILTPTVHFDIETTFQAQGGYGADNPITIYSVITNANATLTNYYCCLMFTNSYSPNPAITEDDWLNLTNNGDGTYSADGVLEWATGGPTYTWLLPQPPVLPAGQNLRTVWGVGMDVITLQGTRTTPTLTIDSIGATQSWQSAQLSTRISITELGVMIIGPYEVVKRVVYRQAPDGTTAKTT